MDITKTITHISLCAGYGGIDLGLRRAIPNLRTVAFSEIEGFACSNLVAKMEAGLLDCAPIWTDLKTFPWGSFSDRVDILSGGYPCQPFSAAGKRLGTDDPRHLWPFIANGIRILRPRFCFFENVEGHITLGLREVISELESMGYAVSWGIFSAREVGAPHQRKRVFILANRKCTGLEGLHQWDASSEQAESRGSDARPGSQRCAWPSRPGQPQHGFEPPRVVIGRMANPNGSQSSEGRGDDGEMPEVPAGEWADDSAIVSGGTSQHRGEGEIVGNAQLHGHASAEITGGIGSEQGEGGMLQPSGVGTSRRDIPDATDGISLANARSLCGERADTNGVCGREICESSRGSEVRSQDSGCGESDGGEGSSMGNAASLGSHRGSENGNWDQPKMFGARLEHMGDTEEQGCGRLDDESSQIGGRETRGHADWSSNPEQWQAEQSMGLPIDGTSNGMGHSELSILSNQELAEIYEWMERCDNRTDELRLLGNGVVPATATLAFQTLLAELLNAQANL